VPHAPVFVLGHWRTGTTLLHELLACDPRLAAPTTYDCFAPHHFLLTRGWLPRLLGRFTPARRPMDNMATGWLKPQEDEFALCNLGIPSPYETMAFPNDPPAHPEYLDLKSLDDARRSEWKATLKSFLQRVTLGDPRRIVLKSPPHTARVATLLEMFPDARFIHIVRDPYEVYASTDRLWRSLHHVQGLQVPRHEGLEEYIFDSLERMYAAFEQDRHLLPPRQLYEVRYEDLVQNPVEQLRAIYDHLQLGGFDDVLPKLEQYQQETRNYRTRTNTKSLPEPIRQKIARRWSRFFERHGYAVEE
jgi:hypothetical protein